MPDIHRTATGFCRLFALGIFAFPVRCERSAIADGSVADRRAMRAAVQSSTGVGLGFLGADGKQTDMTTGLDPTVQLGARTYNPALGRFLSVDPAVGGCANDYVYVKGDPLNHNDPDGRFCWKSWIGVGIGLLGLAAAVAAPFTGGGTLGVWLTWVGVVAGGVAVGLNIQSCAAGDEVACGARAVGGAAFGLGLLAPFLPAMGFGHGWGAGRIRWSSRNRLRDRCGARLVGCRKEVGMLIDPTVGATGEG